MHCAGFRTGLTQSLSSNNWTCRIVTEPETKPRIHNYYGGVTANFTQDNSALLAYTLADQNANNITSSSQQMVQSAQLSIGQGPSSMNQGWGSTMHQTMFDQMTAAQVFNSRSSGLPQPTQGISYIFSQRCELSIVTVPLRCENMDISYS